MSGAPHGAKEQEHSEHGEHGSYEHLFLPSLDVHVGGAELLAIGPFSPFRIMRRTTSNIASRLGSVSSSPVASLHVL